MSERLWLTGDPDSDHLLTDDFFSVLTGTLLDQSIRKP